MYPCKEKAKKKFTDLSGTPTNRMESPINQEVENLEVSNPSRSGRSTRVHFGWQQRQQKTEVPLHLGQGYHSISQ